MLRNNVYSPLKSDVINVLLNSITAQPKDFVCNSRRSLVQ